MAKVTEVTPTHLTDALLDQADERRAVFLMAQAQGQERQYDDAFRMGELGCAGLKDGKCATDLMGPLAAVLFRGKIAQHLAFKTDTPSNLRKSVPGITQLHTAEAVVPHCTPCDVIYTALQRREQWDSDAILEAADAAGLI